MLLWTVMGFFVQFVSGFCFFLLCSVRAALLEELTDKLGFLFLSLLYDSLVQASVWTWLFQVTCFHAIAVLLNSQILMNGSRNYTQLAFNSLYCKFKIVICFVNGKSRCFYQYLTWTVQWSPACRCSGVNDFAKLWSEKSWLCSCQNHTHAVLPKGQHSVCCTVCATKEVFLNICNKFSKWNTWVLCTQIGALIFEQKTAM